MQPSREVGRSEQPLGIMQEGRIAMMRSAGSQLSPGVQIVTAGYLGRQLAEKPMLPCRGVGFEHSVKLQLCHIFGIGALM